MKHRPSKIKKHLSPGLVIGMIALMVALGGVSFAIGRNTVGAKALRAVVVKTDGGIVQPGTRGVFTATCGARQQILGGGVDMANSTTALQLEESHPQGNGWQGIVFSTSAGPQVVTVEALCLKK